MPYITDFTGSLNYDTINVNYESGEDKLVMTFPGYYNKWVDDLENYATNYGNVVLGSYDSVLIAGLGLGVMPYYIQENKECSIIDVVEINEDVIEAVNQLGHLSSSVNLIEDDILTYIPTRNYDLIILDIWWDGIYCQDDRDAQSPLMVTKYLEYLNEGGKVSTPINGLIHTN